MKKTIFIVLALVAFAAQFAGADTLTSLGLPQQIADLLFVGGASIAFVFPVTTDQTGMVIAYKNKELVADRVMPIKMGLSDSLSFKWFMRSLADGYTVPSTLVGRSSRPNTVTFKGSEQSATALAYGLESPVTQEDINEAGKNVENLVTNRLQSLINLVLLDREIRVAGIVQNANNYLSSQVSATATGDKFTLDSANPLKYILGKLDNAIVRPNKVGMGAVAWNALRCHPSIVKAVHGNAGDSGAATRQQVAELLEVSEIIVGSGFVNSAKHGQTPTLSRCWGNHLWAHYDEPLADAKEGLAWGMTVQVGERYAQTVEDPHLGLKGGFWCKAGAYQAEIVTGTGAGILLTDVV